MQTVLIVIHFLVVIALVGVVLIQPSEGGGLGVSSGSGLMRTRGTKNALTRLTAILAFCFFAISIGLIVVGNLSNSDSDILKRINSEQSKGTSKSIPSLDDGVQPSILEQLGGTDPEQEQSKSAIPVIENPVPSLLESPVSDNNTKPSLGNGAQPSIIEQKGSTVSTQKQNNLAAPTAENPVSPTTESPISDGNTE